MKKYENKKYIIIDTKNDKRLNPIYIFFKETGNAIVTNKKQLEENLSFPNKTEWPYETAILYFKNKEKKQ